MREYIFTVLHIKKWQLVFLKRLYVRQTGGSGDGTGFQSVTRRGRLHDGDRRPGKGMLRGESTSEGIPSGRPRRTRTSVPMVGSTRKVTCYGRLWGPAPSRTEPSGGCTDNSPPQKKKNKQTGSYKTIAKSFCNMDDGRKVHIASISSDQDKNSDNDICVYKYFFLV